MPARRIGAFFDVDKTILANNSGRLFVEELYLRGDIGRLTLLRNLASYLRYKLNLLDVDRWARNALKPLEGLAERELVAEAAQFFKEHIEPVIYPEAVRCVREHRDRGHIVALVSGTTRYVVEPLAAHLRVEHVLCSELEVADGVLTGQLVEPICFGVGKVHRLKQLIARENIDLARSYFYTDSMSDLPLLELVGHPAIVNPDPILYREARRRRWPIRFYEDPG